MNLNEVLKALSNEDKKQVNGNVGYTKSQLRKLYNIVKNPRRPTINQISYDLYVEHDVKMSSATVCKYMTEMEFLGLEIPKRAIEKVKTDFKPQQEDYGLRFMPKNSQILLPKNFSHLELNLNN